MNETTTPKCQHCGSNEVATYNESGLYFLECYVCNYKAPIAKELKQDNEQETN